AHHPSLRGDMERVLGKSLEKLPPDRYQSAGEFGDDVRRYLCGQPVLARPVGAIGTAIRWGRRHPLTATLAALTICLLVLGTSISTTLAFVFQAERQRAVAALGFAERESQRASVAEAATQVQLRILARNTYNLQLEQSHALLQRNPRSALLRLNDPKLCLPEFREFTWRHLVYACEHVQQSHVFANYQLRQLAFSLDNQLVAFVDEKSQLHFIELGDNSVRSSAIQADNPSEPRCISLSPESKHLAIGHEDGRISIFEVSTGNLRQTIDQCEASVANLRYRINGELVALDKSATIHVFGAEDYEPTDKLSMVDEPETILASTISPSGLTAAILTRPRQLYITSIHEKKRYRPNFKGSMNALALLNDEQLFIAAQDRLWHMDTRSEKLVPFHHEAGRIQDIVAGGTVVAVLSANSMSLYLHSQPPFRISREPDEQLASISPNGRWLVTTRENAIYVREVSPEATQSHYVGDLAFALAEYTATQFAVLSRNGTILLIDKSTGTVDRIFPSGVQRAMHIAVSDDRQRMAVAGTLSPVRVLDTASGECEFELPERPERRTICRFITPDQLMVLSPNRISTWDLTSKSQVSSLELSGISAVAFTQDLQHFLVGTDDGEIQLRDRTTNDIAKSYGKVDAPPLRIISSAGDRQIAVAMDNRCVAIINPDGKHEVVTCGPHLLPISGLSFSRDNHTLASSSFDGSVRLWDVTNGSQRLAFEKRADACSDVLFLQDDVTLVAAHPVGQVSIWKAVRPPPTNDSLEGK
ncbi:MAG: WD40 repeat domain-containing protein, partial [Planctomycetales bacterium]|nr:WD40 repeat domain-containing protein [Planctomycetales bacterium]